MGALRTPSALSLIGRIFKRDLAWHLAPSLEELRDEINAQWPKRSKSSDGTLGDASHAARKSEHNPDRDADSMPTGAVSAMDITKDSAAQMEAIRKALISDPRTWYVIHNGYIYSRTYKFAKRKYTGSNPHKGHLHVSLMQTKKAHDDVSPWGIYKSQAAPKPPAPKPSTGRKLGSRTLKRGNKGADVAVLQRFLPGLKDDGIFGAATEAAVKNYQRGRKIKADGIAGPKTLGPIVRIVYGGK